MIELLFWFENKTKNTTGTWEKVYDFFSAQQMGTTPLRWKKCTEDKQNVHGIFKM